MPTHARTLKGDSLSLLQAYRTTPDLQTRNRLVHLNIGLVRREAHHWVERCPESYEDLLQVGCLGLIRAIERFDVTKGNAFSSFAIPYIRGEIQHYLRDKSTPIRIPRQWQEIWRRAIKVTQALRVEMGRQPSDRDIAAALNISHAHWQEIKLAHQNREPLSLDCPLGSPEDGSFSLGELVPDHHYRSFQLAQDDQIRLQQALVQLEQRTRDVLEFVFLQDLTQKEAADRLGISVITVSRRVKKGVAALKALMNKA
ncbi:RNA polymerase sigma factor SigF [Spirulina major CS-329]|uniref:RNA polymerase sigma factor SigF n=1 Tax=Spirulina TaxID=1154 RepID=UPI00232D0692|nr:MULTISPECIES: RNA polymerase sigma factor SigF [Spirulina]MDB9496206.1 RNA polymerase sigma factor SigF [Spirulina subsalsa CS-330]MDB9504252.1 RNA polymerase sigma factor SigF [Spirulina major CS-329]